MEQTTPLKKTVSLFGDKFLTKVLKEKSSQKAKQTRLMFQLQAESASADSAQDLLIKEMSRLKNIRKRSVKFLQRSSTFMQPKPKNDLKNGEVAF